MEIAMEIYKGRGNGNSDVLCNIQGNEIFKGRSNSNSDVLFNIQGNEIYKGRSNSNSDVLCNIQGNEIFKGKSYSSNDVLCNIQGNEIFKGKGYSSNGVLCNIQGNEIYKGKGYSSNNVLFNTRAKLSTEQFVAILLTLGLIPSGSIQQQVPSSNNVSQKSFKSAKNAEELGGATAEFLIDKVLKPLSLAMLRKIKEIFKK